MIQHKNATNSVRHECATNSVRDRIVDFVRVPANQIKKNPRNWRTHPERQRSALSAVLNHIGIAGAVIARRTESGLELIDGHLRVEELGDQEVPTLVLDVNEQEAKELLAVYDPIGMLAGTGFTELHQLLQEITLDDQLEQMLNEVSGELLNVEPATPNQSSKLDEPKLIACPECGHEFSQEK